MTVKRNVTAPKTKICTICSFNLLGQLWMNSPKAALCFVARRDRLHELHKQDTRGESESFRGAGDCISFQPWTRLRAGSPPAASPPFSSFTTTLEISNSPERPKTIHLNRQTQCRFPSTRMAFKRVGHIPQWGETSWEKCCPFLPNVARRQHLQGS